MFRYCLKIGTFIALVLFFVACGEESKDETKIEQITSEAIKTEEPKKEERQIIINLPKQIKEPTFENISFLRLDKQSNQSIAIEPVAFEIIYFQNAKKLFLESKNPLSSQNKYQIKINNITTITDDTLQKHELTF